MLLLKPKNILRILITGAMITWILGSCLDPFPLPDVSSGFLVVEGTFTDDPSENIVKLTFAGQVNAAATTVQDARVTVSDDQGGSLQFHHTGQGTVRRKRVFGNSRGGVGYASDQLGLARVGQACYSYLGGALPFNHHR